MLCQRLHHGATTPLPHLLRAMRFLTNSFSSFLPAQQLRTLVWVHKTRLLGRYKIFHNYIERCPCRPCSPLSRSYARSYSRALTSIGPRPCLRAPLSLLGLQGLFIRTPPSADAWRSAADILDGGGGEGRRGGRGGDDRSNAYLVEIFRLQPYAAAAYLRALLYCWIGGVMLQLEAAASFGSGGDTFYERTAWHWLCLQLVLQLLQAPARCKLWRRLVRVSHAPEADQAAEQIRRLVRSHLWMCSQALGTLFHVVAAFGPLFLYMLAPASPVRRSVLAACCGNLLVFIVRSALTFLVVHSIMEARNSNEGGDGGREGPRKGLRRGLSRNSLAKLRRRDSNAEDVMGANHCAICLAFFQEGETLLCLPCHERHVYHTGCIERWLKKNRSCPLCMADITSPALVAALAAVAAEVNVVKGGGQEQGESGEELAGRQGEGGEAWAGRQGGGIGGHVQEELQA